MIKIRDAKKADLEKIVNLHSKTLDTLSSKMGLKYLSLLYLEILARKDLHFLFIAESNKKVIGVISATKELKKTKMLFIKADIIFEALKALFFGRIKIPYLLRRLREERTISGIITTNSLYIMSLFVKKNYQGHGIGTRLIKETLKKAKLKKVFVNTLSENKNAQKFYESFGFKKIRTILGSELYFYTN